MQIELSGTMGIVVAAALVWYLVWAGSGYIVGNWFHIRENRRRDAEEARRERNAVEPWLERRSRVEIEESGKKES